MKAEEIVWPCELPSALKILLLKSAKVHSLDVDHQFVMGKGMENGLSYLIQGLMVLGINSLTKTSPFAIFKTGDWFGGTTFLKEPDFRYKITSVEYSKLLVIPDTATREAACRHPEVYKLLFLANVDHTNKAIDLLFASTGMTLTHKIAYFLLEISQRLPQVSSAQPMISMSQNMLASMLGLSRLTLNQQLHLLEEKNIISVGRKKVCILDVAALEALAGIQDVHDVNKL